MRILSMKSRRLLQEKQDLLRTLFRWWSSSVCDLIIKSFQEAFHFDCNSSYCSFISSLFVSCSWFNLLFVPSSPIYTTCTNRIYQTTPDWQTWLYLLGPRKTKVVSPSHQGWGPQASRGLEWGQRTAFLSSFPSSGLIWFTSWPWPRPHTRTA